MDFRSINVSTLLNEFKGDEEILLDMISLFQESMHEILESMRKSIATKNGNQLRIDAHTFKGLMRSFYADESEKMAYILERDGATLNFSEASLTLHELENHLMLFIYDLQRVKISLDQAA